MRNVREVFPYVTVWTGGAYDLMLIGTARPQVPDTAWVATLLGRGGALAVAGHEYLGLDAPTEYFDRQVMGDAGVARLVTRATLTHNDNRPELEFVAARRFLDRLATGAILDSLVAIQVPVDSVDDLSPLRFARSLSARLGDPAGLPAVRAARAAHPDDPFWDLSLASIALILGDSALTDSVLPRVLARGDDPRALLIAGTIATMRNQPARARALLARALAAGADTGRARATLAVLAARDSLWPQVVADVRASLRATRNTLRSPFPRDLLALALSPLALDGPPAAADSVLVEVIRKRPGWARAYELRAVAALREGACDVAAEQFLTLLEFGIERADGPELMRRCRRGG
jgi:hypothetical protein